MYAFFVFILHIFFVVRHEMSILLFQDRWLLYTVLTPVKSLFRKNKPGKMFTKMPKSPFWMNKVNKKNIFEENRYLVDT